jgi:hypothetical protein
MDSICDVCGARATVMIVFHEGGREYGYCGAHNKIRKGSWEVKPHLPHKKIYGKTFEFVSSRKV